MDGIGIVPQDRKDWAVLFAMLSSVAIGTQVVIVIIALTGEEFRLSVLFLPWLGIAAVILGLIGLAAAPPHSRVRTLCAINALLGILGLVGMLVVLYVDIRNTTWGPVFPTGPTD